MDNLFNFFADFSKKSSISSKIATKVIQNNLQHAANVFSIDIIPLNQSGNGR